MNDLLVELVTEYLSQLMLNPSFTNTNALRIIIVQILFQT